MRRTAFLLVLCLVLLVHPVWGRKTPAGRTALGLSRSNSLRKPIRLAGPGTSVNPRQEELEKAKEKTMRKLQRQQATVATGTSTAAPKKKRGPKKRQSTDDGQEDVNGKGNNVVVAVTNENEVEESDSFELETVEEEVQRSKGGSLSRRKRPLLSLLLQKRRKLDQAGGN